MLYPLLRGHWDMPENYTIKISSLIAIGHIGSPATYHIPGLVRVSKITLELLFLEC